MLKKSLYFALGTLLSRMFGLVRESVIAGVFGATRSLDAFFIAFRLPNLLRELLAEGALGSSFTKVFSELWEQDRQRAIRLLHDALWCFSLLAAVMILTGIIAAPWLVESLTMMADGGIRGPFYQQCVSLTRLMFPFIGFMMLGSIVSGVLHQSGRFFYSAISPILLNLGFLCGALLFAGFLDSYAPLWVEQVFVDKKIAGLALGALLGGALQLSGQALGIWRRFLLPYAAVPRHMPWSKDLAKVLRLMGPMMIAGSAAQVNILVNTNFATSLEAGAVTWLTFAFRLVQLPIGLFAVGIGAVALPSLTRAAVRRQESGTSSELATELLRSIEWMLWLILPCLGFLLLNSPQIIVLLYQHGAFDQSAAEATAVALYYYSFGLVGYGLIKVLNSYYYAIGQTRYPMVLGLVGIGVNFALNSLLVLRYGHRGLAMTSSLVLLCNGCLLLVGIRKIDLLRHSRSLLGWFIGLALAFALCCGGQELAALYSARLVDTTAWAPKFVALWSLGVSGLVVGLCFGPLALVRYFSYRKSLA